MRASKKHIGGSEYPHTFTAVSSTPETALPFGVPNVVYTRNQHALALLLPSLDLFNPLYISPERTSQQKLRSSLCDIHNGSNRVLLLKLRFCVGDLTIDVFWVVVPNVCSMD